MATELRKWWDTLITDGPDYGYSLKDEKCWLKQEKEEIVMEKLKDTDINITQEGKKHLGAVVGSSLTCLNMSMKKWMDG